MSYTRNINTSPSAFGPKSDSQTSASRPLKERHSRSNAAVCHVSDQEQALAMHVCARVRFNQSPTFFQKHCTLMTIGLEVFCGNRGRTCKACEQTSIRIQGNKQLLIRIGRPRSTGDVRRLHRLSAKPAILRLIIQAGLAVECSLALAKASPERGWSLTKLQ